MGEGCCGGGGPREPPPMNLNFKNKTLKKVRKVKDTQGNDVLVEDSSSSSDEEVDEHMHGDHSHDHGHDHYDPKSDGKEEPKKGLNWIALMFLILMIGPAVIQGAISTYDFVSRTSLGDTLGISYRARLVTFYTEHNPRKLKDVDRTLARYRGREDEMFEKLTKKYVQGTSGGKGGKGSRHH